MNEEEINHNLSINNPNYRKFSDGTVYKIDFNGVWRKIRFADKHQHTLGAQIANLSSELGAEKLDSKIIETEPHRGFVVRTDRKLRRKE